MNQQRKKSSSTESSQKYLIPVKNINAFLLSEPDVGYINGRIEEAEKKIVSFEAKKNRSAAKPRVSPAENQDPLDVPFFDISISLPADSASVPETPVKPVQGIEKNDFYIPVKPYRKDPVFQGKFEPENTPDAGFRNRQASVRVPSNQPENAYRHSGPETDSFITNFSTETRPDQPSGISNSFNSIIEENFSHNEDQKPVILRLTIDEALEQAVCSDPFLSENDLLELLKQEHYGGFSLSRRILKKKLIKNGLETRYKRFRAYIAG